MARRLWSTLKGSFASSVLAANVLTVFSGMIPFALVKLALPFAAVRRVVFCSGKVYFDLLRARRAESLKNVALVRVEQLYPFPVDAVAEHGALLAEQGVHFVATSYTDAWAEAGSRVDPADPVGDLGVAPGEVFFIFLPKRIRCRFRNAHFNENNSQKEESMRRFLAHILVAAVLASTMALAGCGERQKFTELKQLQGKEFAIPTGTVADKLVLSVIPDARFKYFNTVLDAAMAVKQAQNSARRSDGSSAYIPTRAHGEGCSTC